MKKLFTLALSFVIASAAFSQTFTAAVSFRTPVIKIVAAPRYVEYYSFTKYQRDLQIDQINRNYNLQVKEVMNMRLSASRKIDLIQQLQVEKRRKIDAVNDRFFDVRNKYNYNHYDGNYNWVR